MLQVDGLRTYRIKYQHINDGVYYTYQKCAARLPAMDDGRLQSRGEGYALPVYVRTR